MVYYIYGIWYKWYFLCLSWELYCKGKLSYILLNSTIWCLRTSFYKLFYKFQPQKWKIRFLIWVNFSQSVHEQVWGKIGKKLTYQAEKTLVDFT